MHDEFTTFSTKMLSSGRDVRVEVTGKNKDDYAEGRLEEISLGYIRGRRRKKNAKETKEESPSMARSVLITGKEREALEF